MTRGNLIFGAMAATLALSAAPALAQRSAGGAESSGSATSRGGGGGDSGGGGAVSRGGGGESSSSSGSSGGGSSSSSGAGSYSAPSSSTRGAGDYVTAPTRPSERQGRTRGGDGGGRQPSGERAVPRGTAGDASGDRTSTRAGGSNDSDPSSRAVPTYSRPRDGRPVQGTAVERTFPRSPGVGGGYYVPPFYGRSYYWPGAYGLGFYYDPLWYDPFFYGGYGFGAGYGGGYYGGGYGNPYGGGASGSGSYSRVGQGSLRLKIKPRDAQVYVDGYFVGTVDEFDGAFQKLTIDAGSHRIEIRAEGREVTSFDVLISPGETVTYKGELKAQ